MVRRHPVTDDALRLLGSLIAEQRRVRAWTQAELAERTGVSVPTLARIERGDPGVAVGTVFEAAVLVGVDLFSTPAAELPRALDHQRLRLALLPARIRPHASPPTEIDDDF